MSGDAYNYYQELAREDYYLEGGEKPGYWFGHGARLLGLFDKVEGGTLKNLWDGMSPDGKTALVNLKAIPAGVQRRPGWDCTFSAPKSVSVIWSQAPAELRREIELAHAKSVETALNYLEAEAGQSRRGSRGEGVDSASLVFAVYEHGTSRNQDPQLHSHALLLNACVREDGTTGTVHTPEVYRHKMTAGALYRAELVHRLQEVLVLTPERLENQTVEFAEVPKNVREFFSTRRAEIVAAMRKLGAVDAKTAEQVALATRHVKGHASRDELFAHWRADGEKLGFGAGQVQSLTGRTIRLDVLQPSIHRFARTQVAELVKTTGHFERQQLVRRLAVEGQYRGWSSVEIRSTVRDVLAERPMVQLVGNSYTTRSQLKLEHKLMERVEALRQDHSHALDSSRLVGGAFDKLDDEHRRAVTKLVSQSGSVVTLRGLPGTGKTTTLKAAQECWTKAGYEVRGLAFSSKAARELEKGADIRSDTIDGYLVKRDNAKPVNHALHVAEQLTRAARGQETWTRERAYLNAKTVVVVDEAAMADTRLLSRVVRDVRDAGAKLVLVGDDRQLQSINAGGVFSAVHQRVEGAELKSIHRQEQAWMRKAVEQVAEGDVASALSAYACRGRVHIRESEERLMRQLIGHWRRDRTPDLSQTLIIASRNRDVDKLNRLAQQRRRWNGELGKLKQRIPGAWVRTNDRVLITKNSKQLGIRNGEFATVERIGLDTITLRLDDNKKKTWAGITVSRRVTLAKKDYDKIRLGYAVSTHKAQGATVAKSFIYLDRTMNNREVSLVQLSRARKSSRLYATREVAGEDLDELAARMSATNRKIMAMRLEKAKPEPIQTQENAPQEKPKQSIRRGQTP